MEKIVYISNTRLPTEKAHGIQIVKTCEALAEQGVEVELVLPNRKNPLTEDIFDFYNIKKSFKVIKLPCWDLITNNYLGKLGFWLESITFYKSVHKYLVGLSSVRSLFPTVIGERGSRPEVNSVDSGLRGDDKPENDLILYTRDGLIAHYLIREFNRVYFELHTIPNTIRQMHRLIWQKAAGLIVISEGLKKALAGEGVDRKKILLARDAFDIAQFNIKETKAECRKKLKLPLDKKLAVYTGHLYGWKGVNLLAEAATALKNNAEVYLVGGTKKDVSSFKKDFSESNLHITGWQEHSLMPYWHKAADVLVIPNSENEKIGALYTSPLKLFEYLASGNPVVASSVPALLEINEILPGAKMNFFEADNVESLVMAIKEVLTFENTTNFDFDDLEQFSWEKRASRILGFLKRFD